MGHYISFQVMNASANLVLIAATGTQFRATLILMLRLRRLSPCCNRQPTHQQEIGRSPDSQQLQTRLGGIPNAQLTRASTDAEIAYFKKSKNSQDRINATNETISTDITDEEDDIVLKSLKNVGLDMLEPPSNNTC